LQKWLFYGISGFDKNQANRLAVRLIFANFALEKCKEEAS
jgi:hypothetical protein